MQQLRPSCFFVVQTLKRRKQRRKSGGITQWVKVIIGINEVNLLLVCQCQYLELVKEEEGEKKKLNREKRAE